MKAFSVVLVVLALVIGILPQFTDCESQGRALTLQNGKQVPMKCHWTGQAEVAMAAPIAILGILSGFSKRKESYRNLGLFGIVLGAGVILLPTNLIGVCADPTMICNSTMLPALILLGSLVAVVGVGMVVMSTRQKDLSL